MELTEYEKEVLRIMLKSEYDTAQIENLIDKSNITKYDFTGVGYFLELSHELFPIERIVVNQPIVEGKLDDNELGFVLFLEDKTLTFECYTFSRSNFPQNIRTKKIKVNLGIRNVKKRASKRDI